MVGFEWGVNNFLAPFVAPSRCRTENYILVEARQHVRFKFYKGESLQ